MSVVAMSEFKLIGLEYHKENILNALHKTGSVQLVETSEIPETLACRANDEKQAISSYYDRLRDAVEFITRTVQANKKSSDSAVRDYMSGNFLVSMMNLCLLRRWKKNFPQ